jgi:hypothetical protein
MRVRPANPTATTVPSAISSFAVSQRAPPVCARTSRNNADAAGHCDGASLGAPATTAASANEVSMAPL